MIIIDSKVAKDIYIGGERLSSILRHYSAIHLLISEVKRLGGSFAEWDKARGGDEVRAVEMRNCGRYTMARVCGVLECYSVIFRDGNSTKGDVLDALVELAAEIAEKNGIEEYE